MIHKNLLTLSDINVIPTFENLWASKEASKAVTFANLDIFTQFGKVRCIINSCHLSYSAQVYEVEGKEQEEEHSCQGSSQCFSAWSLEVEDVDVGARFFPRVCSIIKVHGTAVIWK